MQAVCETGIPVWVPKLWRPKKQFSSISTKNMLK